MPTELIVCARTRNVYMHTFHITSICCNFQSVKAVLLFLLCSSLSYNNYRSATEMWNDESEIEQTKNNNKKWNTFRCVYFHQSICEGYVCLFVCIFRWADFSHLDLLIIFIAVVIRFDMISRNLFIIDVLSFLLSPHINNINTLNSFYLYLVVSTTMWAFIWSWISQWVSE